MAIDMVPEVALLRIFEFYFYKAKTEAWQTLIHVCRKWRHVVFGSPRRLNLQLVYKARKPVMLMLDLWPPLPIIIRVFGYDHETVDVDNIIAALEHNDRICQLTLVNIPSVQFEKVLAAMQQPFPKLTLLELLPKDDTTPVDPSSFLGGSAPRLQTLVLGHFHFPGLPTLLLSATNLVRLDIFSIPHAALISPGAIVASLSVLTRLESLKIAITSPRSNFERATRRGLLQTRILLPALTKLQFFGVGPYLEDLLARIVSPLLDKLDVNFCHQLISDTPHLTQFISRSPKFRAQNEARVVMSNFDLCVILPQTFGRELKLGVSCRRRDWQLSSLTRICSSSFPRAFIPAVERLYIIDIVSFYENKLENSQWLDFLRPFPVVKCLYLSRRAARRIAPALQELVGERVTEVLPVLQTLFLESQETPAPGLDRAVGQFVDARRLGGHPITVSPWERKRFE
jgi:hypothetical protein